MRPIAALLCLAVAAPAIDIEVNDLRLSLGVVTVLNQSTDWEYLSPSGSQPLVSAEGEAPRLIALEYVYGKLGSHGGLIGGIGLQYWQQRTKLSGSSVPGGPVAEDFGSPEMETRSTTGTLSLGYGLPLTWLTHLEILPFASYGNYRIERGDVTFNGELNRGSGTGSVWSAGVKLGIYSDLARGIGAGFDVALRHSRADTTADYPVTEASYHEEYSSWSLDWRAGIFIRF